MSTPGSNVTVTSLPIPTSGSEKAPDTLVASIVTVSPVSTSFKEVVEITAGNCPSYSLLDTATFIVIGFLLTVKFAGTKVML